MAYITADERRSQVVAAARAALVRDGVSRMTMRSVAAEARIPLGNLHYAFPSKAELLRAVLENIIDEIVRGLRQNSPRGGTLAESLRQGLHQIWADGAAAGPGLQLLQYELTMHALRTPGLAELASWQYDQYVAALAGWCRAAADDADENSAVDFDELARFLLAGLDGLILQHLARPNTARSTRDLDHIVAAAIAIANPRRREYAH
jgi:AcrR family transcriptional regulator